MPGIPAALGMASRDPHRRYRRCPSGDDPTTPDDETCVKCDASVSASSITTWHGCCNLVRSTGLYTTPCGGTSQPECSRVHVDCSRRGLCDHETGTCACNAGWQGAACEVPERLSQCRCDHGYNETSDNRVVQVALKRMCDVCQCDSLTTADTPGPCAQFYE